MKLTLLFSLLTSSFIFAQLQYVGGDFIATSIIMTNTDTIYAGNNRSFDNGLTWTTISDANGSLDNYFSSSTGIVEKDDSLYHTSDYGDTWTPISYIPNLESVMYSDNQDVLYAYTLTSYIDGTATKPVSHIYKSNDEGMSWSEVTLPYYIFEGDSLACQNMNVLSEDTVLLAMRAAGPSYTLPTYLFSSYDGGETWDTTSMEFHTVATMDFITSEVGFFTGLNLFYKTTDAGESWETQEVCPEVKSIDFVSAEVGYISGIDGSGCSNTTLKTVNGGISWEPLDNCTPCDAGTGYEGWGIFAMDENNMIATGLNCEGMYNYIGLSCIELSVEESQISEVKIYPVPALEGQVLTISNENEIPINYRVLDVSGKLIRSGIIQSNGAVSLDGLESGTYIFESNSEGLKRTSEKFIVL